MAPNGHNKPVDVLVIGLGAVGSAYSYLLEKAGKARVTAVARSNYDLLADGKVTLVADGHDANIKGWKPYRVFKSQKEALESADHFDFCLITTKCLPDIVKTPELVREVIASGQVGAWALIQNGLDVEADLHQAVKHLETPIVSSTAWCSAMTADGGRRVVLGRGEALACGVYPPPASSSTTANSEGKAKLDLWVDLLKSANSAVFPVERIDSVRYYKNLMNCVWSSIETLSRAFPSRFDEFPPEVQAPMKAFISEIVEVGYQSGLLREDLPRYPAGDTQLGPPEKLKAYVWDWIVDSSVSKEKAGISPHKMSMWTDADMRRPLEVEVIEGSVLKVAKSIGVETPLLAYTYALLKGMQAQIVKDSKSK